MPNFIQVVGNLLAKHWNTSAFQFRLEHFVSKKRDREILSHFHGWSQSRPEGTFEEWHNALQGEPKFKNKGSDFLEGTLKDALIQVGCEYPNMDKYSLAELQVANRKFELVMEAAGKISPPVSHIPSVRPHDTLTASFKRKMDELEGERDRLTTLANSGGGLAEKLEDKQTDLKVAKQECTKLKSQVKSMLNEIMGNLSTEDIGDVEKADNKMREYKKLIGQRDDALGMVGGLEREISALKRAIEEQKKESRKDIAVKQQSLSQSIDVLVKAADILGVSLEATPVKVKQTAEPRKVNGAPRRRLATPPKSSQSSSSQFTLSEDQRRRINALPDGVWYGTKKGFGHAGVMRAKSQNPDFKTNADFLQAMIDWTYNQKADQIPGSTTYGLLRDISAVRNRIAIFPIWDGIWTDGGAVNPDALETFIQSREQAILQPQAS